MACGYCEGGEVAGVESMFMKLTWSSRAQACLNKLAAPRTLCMGLGSKCVSGHLTINAALDLGQPICRPMLAAESESRI